MSVVKTVEKRVIDNETTGKSAFFLKKKKVCSPLVRSKNKIGSNGLSQCFKNVTTRLYLSIAPCYVNDPINAIKVQHLDPLIMTFYNPLGGVILSYSNLRVSNSMFDEFAIITKIPKKKICLAKIQFDTPFAFLWVSVDFLIWKPEINDKIQGWCYMQTPSHIGLLIHDIFNATIKRNSIPSNWQFISNQIDEIDPNDDSTTHSLGHWLDSEGNKIDAKLDFFVKSIHSAGRAISIEGLLIDSNNEINFFSNNSSNNASTVTSHQTNSDNNSISNSNTILEANNASILSKYDNNSENDEDDEDNKIVNQSDNSDIDSDSD
ncbi:DNA-directed RNA polymerase I subunit RPA43 ASCRUDRAFT_30048 [Ascoidea rubescens DSM 1968]|uniref:DNA-directed RNA polymerase subunit n=1 Tax=Ascoidea rubescens DSM 1968 TaxID=1344418 RepID=A0A1D2VP88_9ASCO|nr:hypothetical protein ASCRUDRAFT_30048 [Ascoidea rubescens DSM 1968]ODV63418.1 hypothetical protein ASCRUDRAFT_30048 [Ascoidea rubescens DSM 1968]